MAVRIRERLDPYVVSGPDDTGEYRAYCPLCENPETSNSPSCSINYTTGLFFCQSCSQGGRLLQLTRAMKNVKNVLPPKKATTNGHAKPDAGEKEIKPLPGAGTIDNWHRQLLMRPQSLKWLQSNRGLNPATLKKYKIGWDGQRITIPVYDIDGELVNVRRYKPNARGPNKMISWGPGFGAGRLLNPRELVGLDEVFLCEGEMDYLVARQHKIPAATHTSGAGHFKPQWGPAFKDKVVYVAYDEDDSGNKGASKVASMLKNYAQAVYRVQLGTDIKGGDVTDYFVSCGGDHDSFMMLRNDATLLWERTEKTAVPKKGKPVTVEESQNVDYLGQALEMNVMVIGKQSPAFLAPKKLAVSCDQGAGQVCAFCPIAVSNGKVEVEIEPNDERLLSFINTSDSQKQELYRKMTGAKCQKNVEFVADDGYNIEEIMVSPSIDHRSEDTETPISRKVYNVGTYKTPVNNTARIVGKQVPDPQSQRGTFMGWDLELLANDIDEFKMNASIRDQLLKFQVVDGQDPLSKCIEIAQDMSANVTKIYGRDIMHVAMDLVWHSVIGFKFEEHQIRKGWLEALVLGDTRTGKSEAATALRRHYGAGVVRSCEGASFAGLVGGAQQMGSRGGWMVTWGTIPLNDRRIVILDEMSGLMANKDAHILGDMSSVRSEGRAAITKIVSEETSARTRLLWLSNPSTGERLANSPGSALQALQRLVRNPEDVARFDYVMAVTNSEVSSSVINSSHHTEVPHIYDSDSCHALVTWAWSRKTDDVQWGAGAEMSVLKAAEQMGASYHPDPPLVQVENIRIKLARIAVAFAARTFSTDDTGEKLIVRKSHVYAAVKFLREIYSSEAMSYVQRSNRFIQDDKIADTKVAEAKEKLLTNPKLASILCAIGTKPFKTRELDEMGVSREEVQSIIDDLHAMRMVRLGQVGTYKAVPQLLVAAHELESERYE